MQDSHCVYFSRSVVACLGVDFAFILCCMESPEQNETESLVFMRLALGLRKNINLAEALHEVKGLLQRDQFRDLSWGPPQCRAMVMQSSLHGY